MPPPSVPEHANRLRVISGLGVFEILTWGSSFYLPAVLSKPIVDDTGWPLAGVVGALSVGLLVAGLVSPLVGRLIASHGGRPMLVGSACFLAAGLTILGFSPSLPVFYGGWVVIGAGMGAGLYDAAFATLGRLYGQSARSAITALTLWGGFASTVCWPLSALLVEQLGWRGACLTYAAIHLFLSLPIVLLSVPSTPRPQHVSVKSTTGDPARTVDRSMLILLAGIGIATGAVSAALSVHILAILQDMGLTLAAAVGVGALIGPAQVGARLLEMAGRGRHHPLWTLTAATMLIAMGIALLWSGMAGAVVALVLYGGGNGLNSIAKGTVPLALFGTARYAQILGALALPNLLAQALAPSLFAVALSRYGTGTTLAIAAAFAGGSVVMVAALWVCSTRNGTR